MGIPRAGSSPLTRGKLAGQHQAHGRRRLIPAHAGKTRFPRRLCPHRRAHPRSRGENPCSRAGRTTATGSSPLTRGKRGFAGRADEPPGLIPAHAGKTASRTARWCCGRAHPRSRGENLYEAMRDGKVSGSSPLTRGKPGPFGAWRPKLGLIPAHAGKTVESESEGDISAAHPRSRGENPAPGRAAGPPAGLIPAHAGKTIRRGDAGSDTGAHPRSRGENARPSSSARAITGSSPLTREKRPSGPPQRRGPGLIPAHAGKTRSRSPLGTRPRAHPRSRGENGPPLCEYWPIMGSSPLTRGKPMCAHARHSP